MRKLASASSFDDRQSFVWMTCLSFLMGLSLSIAFSFESLFVWLDSKLAGHPISLMRALSAIDQFKTLACLGLSISYLLCVFL